MFFLTLYGTWMKNARNDHTFSLKKRKPVPVYTFCYFSSRAQNTLYEAYNIRTNFQVPLLENSNPARQRNFCQCRIVSLFRSFSLSQTLDSYITIDAKFQPRQDFFTRFIYNNWCRIPIPTSTIKCRLASCRCVATGCIKILNIQIWYWCTSCSLLFQLTKTHKYQRFCYEILISDQLA
jgi:hypothetical protein